MLTHLSLFSGIGGIDIAAEWAGFETICFVEIDDYCQKILSKHWPNVPIIGDIKDVRGADYSATLITGGFPCQPVSHAGKRQGKDDDRWLWSEMLRVISEIRPTWVVAENVAGLIGMVEYDSEPEMDLKEYSEDQMAAALFDVGQLFERTGRGYLDEILGSLEAIGYKIFAFLIPACGVDAPHRRNRIFIVAVSSSERRNTGCGDRQRGHILPNEGVAPESKQAGEGRECRVGEIGSDVAHSNRIVRSQGRYHSTREQSRYGKGIQGQRPIDDWWSTEPSVGRVASGIPSRVDRLKCLGNAVVPQQIYPILKAIADIERSKI